MLWQMRTLIAALIPCMIEIRISVAFLWFASAQPEVLKALSPLSLFTYVLFWYQIWVSYLILLFHAWEIAHADFEQLDQIQTDDLVQCQY